MSEFILGMRENATLSSILFTLANHCMPTLLKSKPSNMVSFSKRYIESKSKFETILQQELDIFSVKYFVLYEDELTYIVLLYNEDLLKGLLKKNRSHYILKENGYKTEGEFFEEDLLLFQERFYKYKGNIIGFPHEIGIFLGYPVKDVEEYIKHQGKNYLRCGYWKVYTNVEEADKTFRLFQRLRNRGLKLFFDGKELCEIFA